MGHIPRAGCHGCYCNKLFFAVTYTHANTLHKFWINGVSQGSGVSASINTGIAEARIGHRVTGSEVWGPNGQIYQILVYNRALSDSEILQNFNANKAKYGL
ncbi:LamG domain-containing protein [Pedobacter aquae]|uniref:LamG domain-containing protein n=1 Tax=Pedobacter aquae TaxID=2605747 RepID=A0A5C0VKD2_9SPHI|nr:LamG domain-containing protein [Pedobacter aquae]